MTIPLDQATAMLRQAEALIRAVLEGSAPASVEPAGATSLTQALGRIDLLVAPAMVAYANAAGRDRTGLLSTASGTSTRLARQRLDMAGRVARVPEVDTAMRHGQVSLEQAAMIAKAAEAAPDAAGPLLETARDSSFAELKAEAERTIRQSRSEEEQQALERRAYARRYCRIWREHDGVRIDALLGPVQGAKVMAALDKETEALFRESWSRGRRVPRERLAADALYRLLGAGTVAQMTVRVDMAALTRGSLADGEICEIEGVGPVSVDAVRTLVPEAFFNVVIRHGTDIRTVTSTSRVIPRKLRTALKDRDQCCVVPNCGSVRYLEIDHWQTQVRDYGPTQLDNLCRICSIHHDMRHEEGWQLGGGPGRWSWDHPGLSPGRRSRA